MAWAVGGGAGLGIGAGRPRAEMTFPLSFWAAMRSTRRSSIVAAGPLPLLALGYLAIALAGISLFPAAGTLQHTLRAGFDYEAQHQLRCRSGRWLGWRPRFSAATLTLFGLAARGKTGYAGILASSWPPQLVRQPNRQTLFLRRRQPVLPAAGPYSASLSHSGPSYRPSSPFQVPARYILLFNFAWPLLAAVGLDALTAARDDAPPGACVCSSWPWRSLRRALPPSSISVARAYPSKPDRAGQMLRAILVFIVLAAAGWLWLAAAIRRAAPVHPRLLALLLLFVRSLLAGSLRRKSTGFDHARFCCGSPALAFLHADPGIHRLDIVAGPGSNLP